MTARNFFIVVLRILGIILIKDILGALTMVLMGLRDLLSSGENGLGLLTFLWGLLILTIYLAVSYAFIFKADMITHRLKLTQGFDEPFLTCRFSMRSILIMAIIVAGFLMLMIETPEFCRQLYSYFMTRKMELNAGVWNSAAPAMVAAIVKILFGLLVIGEHKRIAAFLLKKRNDVK